MQHDAGRQISMVDRDRQNQAPHPASRRRRQDGSMHSLAKDEGHCIIRLHPVDRMVHFDTERVRLAQ